MAPAVSTSDAPGGSFVDHVVSFLTESDFWAENSTYLGRSDVIHHEVNIETSLHPLGLEYLFVEYLKACGRHVRNVGHAIVEDSGYIKIYTVERPIVNIVWKYRPDVVIGPQADRWFTTWTDRDERDYLERVMPRRATADDLGAVEDYLATGPWQDVLDKLADPEMEHFHAFVRTELHPYDLEGLFKKAIVSAGYEIVVPAFYLAQPDDHPLADGREAMWIGLIPDGSTSLEISCIHAPGAILEPKELSAKERFYGGDGWTIGQLKEFIRRAPYEILTLNEAQEILRRVARAGSATG